jgi:acyl-coenzyme A thioesterase PaaI-like protein
MSEPGAAGERASFNSEMGFTYRIEEGLALGWGWHADELSVPGTAFPHASAVLTYADTLLGLLSSAATAPRLSLTADLRAQIISVPPFGPIEMDGRLLKTGRTTTLGKTSFSVPGAALPFAICFGTFIGSPRPVDVQPFDRSRAGSAEAGGRTPGVTLTEPFAGRVGIRMIDTGVAEVDRRADVLNSSNSIQGGVLAFVAEVAAQSLATEHAGRTFVVDDLDVLPPLRPCRPRAGRGARVGVLRDRRNRRSGNPRSRRRQPHAVVCHRAVCRGRRVTIRPARSGPTWWERTPPPDRAPRGSGGHPAA